MGVYMEGALLVLVIFAFLVACAAYNRLEIINKRIAELEEELHSSSSSSKTPTEYRH
jgi:hypothetical protein